MGLALIDYRLSASCCHPLWFALPCSQIVPNFRLRTIPVLGTIPAQNVPSVGLP